MALITPIMLAGSVGRNGKNYDDDVAAIGQALVAIGPDRGGIFAVPLSKDGLIQAIEAFQKAQRLPARNGRIDRGDATLRRINEIIDPDAFRPAAKGSGKLRLLPPIADLSKAVDRTARSPHEASLVSEFVFQWGSVSGKGTLSYFELDLAVVPRWFGVLVPDGHHSFDKAHIFFHPTPSQAGHGDADYQALGSFLRIFHYLSEKMGAQFCAAKTDRVLIMPLMTQAAAGDCGVFPQQWESIVSRIFGMLKSGDMSESAPPASISSVVVSSFSNGIIYSHQFRHRAKLGARLTGVIDFDGGISTYSQLSAAIANPGGQVVKMHQMASTKSMISRLAVQKTFPLGRPRWGGPFANYFSTNDKVAMWQIHPEIPQTMMYIAAQKAG